MVLYDGGAWLVQRLLYTWSFGPIPKSVRLRRTCGTPWCVRPDHARLYSAARNVNDMEMREWVLTDARCPAGHRKAEHGRRDRSRRLYCAECLRIKSRRYR